MSFRRNPAGPKKALPEHGRAHNRSLILQELFHDGPRSRADLARSTGLTRVTISDLAAELIADELIEEQGTANVTGKVGKPAMMLGLRTDSYLILAVDLMDDGQMHGALLDITGTIQHRERKTKQALSQEGIESVIEFCKQIMATATAPLLGVGISTPGVVSEDGTIINAPNRSWFNVPLAAILTQALGIQTLVTNDANAVALAELTFGAGNPASTLSLSVGLGLGAGLVIDGEVVTGATGVSGEIGHVKVVGVFPHDPLGPAQKCACGNLGCLETLVSIPRLRQATSHLTEAETENYLTAVGTRFGQVLAPLVATLNLSEIIISGPVDLCERALIQATDKSIRDHTFELSTQSLEVRMTQLAERGPLAGAAVLVLAMRLGIK